MKKQPLWPLLFCAALISFSCSDRDNGDDLTNDVNHDGGVESAITVSPLDSNRHVLITTHKVWVANKVYKTVEYRDTLPGLGTTLTTAENSDGDTQTVPVKRDYEIYITVK